MICLSQFTKIEVSQGLMGSTGRAVILLTLLSRGVLHLSAPPVYQPQRLLWHLSQRSQLFYFLSL